MWYFDHLNETFVTNTHYEEITVNKDDIIDSWKTTFDIHRWNKIFPWRSKGTLPYGYILPKDKDITRDRPIISYASHPARSLLNTISRAILAILKFLSFEHFILWKTQDAFSFFNDIHNNLSVFGNNTR